LVQKPTVLAIVPAQAAFNLERDSPEMSFRASHDGTLEIVWMNAIALGLDLGKSATAIV